MPEDTRHIAEAESTHARRSRKLGAIGASDEGTNKSACMRSIALGRPASEQPTKSAILANMLSTTPCTSGGRSSPNKA